MAGRMIDTAIRRCRLRDAIGRLVAAGEPGSFIGKGPADGARLDFPCVESSSSPGCHPVFGDYAGAEGEQLEEAAVLNDFLKGRLAPNQRPATDTVGPGFFGQRIRQRCTLAAMPYCTGARGDVQHMDHHGGALL